LILERQGNVIKEHEGVTLTLTNASHNGRHGWEHRGKTGKWHAKLSSTRTLCAVAQ